MFDRGNGRLHDEQIRPGLLRDAPEALRLLRNGTDRRQHAGRLQLLHAPGDQFLLDRLGVKLLDQLGDILLARLDDLVEHVGRIGVARLHALEVDDPQAAQLAHFDAKAHVGDPVHRAGDDRDFQRDETAVRARDFERSIHFVRVDGHFSGHKGDFVKSISDARLSISSNPHSHRSIPMVQFEDVWPPDSKLERLVECSALCAT